MRPTAPARPLVLATAIGALLPFLAVSPAHADTSAHPGWSSLGGAVTNASGPLTDLHPKISNSTDVSDATVVIARGIGGSYARITVSGLAAEAAGHQVGVHVHTGPCIAGDPEAAGPHYNHDRATGREPVRVSPRTEVWLDLTPDRSGSARAETVVPFPVPQAGAGAGSVVVHEHPTDHAGMAGDRLACLSLAYGAPTT